MNYGSNQAICIRRCGSPNAAPTENAVKRLVQGAVEYLVRHTSDIGRFTYVYDASRGASCGGYNFLRHAGTVMALYGSANLCARGEDVSAAADRAWSYLRTRLGHVRINGRSCYFLDDGPLVKLGGVALTALALAARLEILRRQADEEHILRGLAEYIVMQQLRSGCFFSYFDCRRAVSLRGSSLYYSGQSVLALATTYVLTGEVAFLRSADAGMRYLAAQHRQTPPSALGFADHWSMLALAKLFKITTAQCYLSHLRYLVAPLLEDGAWLKFASITRISTRLEGLVALLELELAAGECGRASSVYQRIVTGIARICETQIGHPDFIGPPLNGDARGGIIRSQADLRVRVDYVQHALSAACNFSTLVERLGQCDFACRDHFRLQMLLSPYGLPTELSDLLNILGM